MKLTAKGIADAIEIIRARKGIVVDRNSPYDTEYRIKHVAVYRTPEKGDVLVPVFLAKKFPINPIEINTLGVPVISKERFGDIVDTSLIPMFDLPSFHPEFQVIVEI